MATQDGVQAAGTVTATSTGAVAFSYANFASGGTSANLLNQQFHNFQIIASTSNAGVLALDWTSGVTALATTSVGYPLAAGELFPRMTFSDRGRTAYYSGFSFISASGTATLKFAAW